MKIFLLSDANSIHTIKWVKSLSDRGLEILLFSLFEPNQFSLKNYKQINVRIITPNFKIKIDEFRKPSAQKIQYLLTLPQIMKNLRNFKPDILHAHYSSSYGLLGSLCGFKPFFLSVWGSDIQHFPYQGKIPRLFTKFVISKPDIICSTSISMKETIQNEYKRDDVQVIPFGIDTEQFRPALKDKEKFIVGTIKSIESHNGIDCLLDAADILINKLKKDINFIIVGSGSYEKTLKIKCKNLKLNDKVDFVGYVNHDKVINYYNILSIFVAVSERESFGVSVLEAAACEIPSITTNVGGLPEVNLNNKTGIIIDSKSPIKLAESILHLYNNKQKRDELGLGARKRVIKEFSWKKSVDKMIDLYEKY